MVNEETLARAVLHVDHGSVRRNVEDGSYNIVHSKLRITNVDQANIELLTDVLTVEKQCVGDYMAFVGVRSSTGGGEAMGVT